MKKHYDDIFTKYLPTIDLHGYDRESARVMVNDFILENYRNKSKSIIIIHGVGMGIIKKAVHETLKNNRLVLKYNLHSFNIGMTVVTLK